MIAVLSVLLAPIIPLVIEWWFTSHISAGSLLISAIMYVAGMAFSTDKKIIFFLGFFAVAYLCVMYGAGIEKRSITGAHTSNQAANAQENISSSPSDSVSAAPNVDAPSQNDGHTLNIVASDGVYNSAIILMICFAVAQLLQRIRMHLKDAQPFLDFRVSKAKKGSE